MMNIDPLVWTRMALLGYLLTVCMETPVLYVGLGRRYSVKQKLFSGAFLTACSYPFVVVFFPMLWNPYENYTTYITIAEIFAPLSECIIFSLLFHRGKRLGIKMRMLDYATIIGANLFSYLGGELMKSVGLHL